LFVALFCLAAAIVEDIFQDLNTGCIVGSSPKWQQIAQLYGVLITSIAIGVVLVLLHNAFSFGSEALPAPQAVLMPMFVAGIMSGNLAWSLIFVGAAAAATVELFGIR